MDYGDLFANMRALLDKSDDPVSNLANASALLMESLPDINWVGFYLLRNNALALGPFQGRVACVRIEMGRGVCGLAASENRVIRVPNVHEFPGHIACDGASNAELVVPLNDSTGRVIGVLDIDSPIVDRFSPSDADALTEIAGVISSSLQNESTEHLFALWD